MHTGCLVFSWERQGGGSTSSRRNAGSQGRGESREGQGTQGRHPLPRARSRERTLTAMRPLKPELKGDQTTGKTADPASAPLPWWHLHSSVSQGLPRLRGFRARPGLCTPPPACSDSLGSFTKPRLMVQPAASHLPFKTLTAGKPVIVRNEVVSSGSP